MATKKSQTASKTAPKATKTVTTASGKTKTIPAKKPATKPKAAPAPKPTAKKPKETGRIVACIIGFIAAIALVVIAIVAITNCVQNRDMVVTDGTGKKFTSQYVGFMDDGFRAKVPETFEKVDPSTLSTVATSNGVLGAYTDKDDTISVIVGVIEDTNVNNDQIENYAKTMKDAFAVNGKVLDSKTYVKDGHNIAQMRVSFGSGSSELIEDITFFAQDNQVVMTIITYGEANAEKWQPVSEFISDSFEFTK